MTRHIGLDEVARVLGAISKVWLNPADPLCREAVEALQVSTGYSRPMIEAALDAAFSELTAEKLTAFFQSEPAFAKEAVRRVLHILPANVFTAWLPGAVITLALGAECILKPSRQEPVFPALWKRSLERFSPELSELVRIVDWQEELLQQVDAVVVYGSDETLEALRAKLPAGARFVGYGHKLSVGVIFQDALQQPHQVLEAVRADAAPFHLQGCLSPQMIFVEKGTLPDSGVEPAPQVVRFEEWGEVRTQLQKLKPYLSALGYAGPSSRIESIQADLYELGFNRICPLGEMQRPPISWQNGGISLVEVLTA